uniref:Regulatory protein YycH domain-containing protein n=1 Tax=uncultured Bacillota bacterium TaxID=344338 RepID=A0A650EPE9_9FIRM|nr:hypothetical protein Firmicute1046_2870 [uncultured Firmicutes bacterium]
MEGKTRKTDGRLKKERYKTGAIIVLVLFAVYFSTLLIQTQVLKEKPISFFVWENFAAVVHDAERNSAAERAGTYVFDLFNPQYFAVTRADGTRDVFRGQSEMYRELKPLLRTLTAKLYKGEALPVTVEEEKERGKWYESLQTASVYAKLPCRVDTQVYAQMLGLESSDVCKELLGYQEMSVSVEGEKVVFYFFDESANRVVSFHTALDGTELRECVENAVQIVAKNYVFAFETDKSEIEDSPSEVYLTTNVKMRDTMLIPAVTVATPKLTAQTPAAVNRTDFHQKVFELFGYRPSDIRQYTDGNGVQVFVDEYSTLRVHTDGFVEYKANEPKYGLSLTGDARPSKTNVRYQSLLGVERIALRLMEVAGMDTDNEAHGLVLRELTGGESADDEVKVRMEYCFEGRAVEFDDSETGRRSAISAVISQGKLMQMSCYLKELTAVEDGAYFSSEWELTPNESLFNAIERNKADAGEISQIQDAYLYYPVPYVSTQVHTVWKIETK